MKEGKWNYTEKIEYTVIEVLLLEVPETPLHWQNAFAGEVCQAVFCKTRTHQFIIDNQDGSGLHKVAQGGGPGCYSAHIDACEFIGNVPESEWIQWNPIEHIKRRDHRHTWMKQHFPEGFKRMEMLREQIQSF